MTTLYCSYCNKLIHPGDLPVVLVWGDRPEHLPNFFGRSVLKAVHWTCTEGHKGIKSSYAKGRNQLVNRVRSGDLKADKDVPISEGPQKRVPFLR